MSWLKKLLGRESGSLHGAAAAGDNDAIRRNLDRGADVNARNSVGQTPLAVATFNKHPKTAKLLVERGAALDAVDRNGVSILHFAAHHGDADLVHVIIARGGDVNARESKGWVPLHSAIAEGHTRIANILLDNGADPLLETDTGKSALDFAKHFMHDDLIERLGGSTAEERAKSSGVSAEVVAKLGLGAMKLVKAAKILGEASSPGDARKRLKLAADVLAELTEQSPINTALLNDVPDSQVVELCQQMAVSLADQAKALALETKRLARSHESLG